MIRPIRIVLAVTVSGTLILTACGDSQTGNSTAIDAPNPETTSSTSAVASTTEPAAASATPPHGVLVYSWEDDPNDNEWVEYGTFDLATGEYTKFKTFYAPEGAELGGLSSKTDRHSSSPDWTKIVATMHVGSDTHAGWVDERGIFTDITAAVMRAPVGDFTSGIGHTGFGFDNSNHFYFLDTDGGKLMQVSLNNPSIASETGTILDGGDSPPHYVWMPNDNLWTPNSGPKPVGYDDMCRSINSVAWIDEYTFVEEDGETQLGVGDIRKNPCPVVGFSRPYERELLPEGTGYEIRPDVVLNPARDTVAFIGSAGPPRFSGLFTVPISGGSPTKTAVTEEMLQGYRLIGWN
ncbi:hypothetical protein ACWELP_10095 [Rhodococcus aetherivorans]